MKYIKCLVWDLDNTIWNGILSEDEKVSMKGGILETIKILDHRGILQSVSSKNDYNNVMEKMKELGILEYFIYPKINWSNKSESIKKISEEINIGIDTIAFIDDSEFESMEVNYSFPEVRCYDAGDYKILLSYPEFNPEITEDSKNRRTYYQNDIQRNKLLEDYSGPKKDFLKTLNITINLKDADKEDLDRIKELTERTHQLNSTGTVYSYEQLLHLINDKNYILLVCELNDRLGQYGKIGVALINITDYGWHIKLLLTSCRVMSVGVGSALLNYLIERSLHKEVSLYADFIPNDRNKVMYITYKMAGFVETEHDIVKNREIVLKHNGARPVKCDYIRIIDGGVT